MSAGPARALGLFQKGNLGLGCDGDVVIYEEDPNVRKMFGHPRYVIKGGEIVLEDGEIREAPPGREFLVKPPCDPGIDTSCVPFETVIRCNLRTIPEIERIHNPRIKTASTCPR
jgi:formylmethanofuran dehydrogenase subunit A